ncbi:hypothetical protein [uncultured Eubacterium sp.]|uniref:hypothetical protein n=1 Tax=uncultured Eubacterium sp. TaxID=165185 RepID=UPI002591F6FB|nr:hypothetical protein [uncultured Eubacterium sp.]
MKIKKLLCTVLVATLMVPTTGIFNPGSAVVSAASRPILTGEKYETPVGVDSTDDIVEIKVKETGIYTLSAMGYDLNYKVFSGDTGKTFGEIVNVGNYENMNISENFYFKADTSYYMSYSWGGIIDNEFRKDVKYDAEFSLEKSKLTLDSNKDIHPIVSAKVLGKYEVEEVDDINTIEGVKWTEETNTLEFKNYNGNHTFNIEYTPAFFYNPEDLDKKDVDFNDELVINVKGKNTFAGMYIRGLETAINVKNIATRFVGDGVMNFKNGIDPDVILYNGAAPTTSEEYVVFNSNRDVTFAGPSLEIEELGKFIPISAGVINMNNGYIVVDSLNYTSVDELGKGDLGSGYLNLPILGADIINLDGGVVYLNLDGGPGESYHFWSMGCFHATYEATISYNVKILINGNLFKFELEDHRGSKDDVIYLFVLGNLGIFNGEVRLDENVIIEDDLDKVIIPEPSDPDKEEENNNNQENNNQESGQVVNNDQSANADNKQTTDKKTDDTKKVEDKKTAEKKADEKVEEVVAVGSKLSDKNFNYVVTKAGTKDGKTVGEVELTGVKNVKTKNLTIKGTVKIDGVKYNVTSIGKKAFAKAKKLKKINIKSKFIKKIAKGAFKKTNKKLVVKVPKKQKKAYKKLIKKAGFKGKVK